MRSFLPNDIKDNNRNVVFELLLQNPEMAKVEITRKTTMSFVTVSKIVDFFEEIKLLKTDGQSRDGSGGLGRKRVVYTFDENSYVAIGMQVIGNKITAVLVNLYGQVIAVHESHTEVPFYHEEFKDVFAGIVDYMSQEAEKTGAELVGVGIGVDGAINRRKKTIRMRTDAAQENDFSYEPILDNLRRQVDLPIVLENDVNASTLSEMNQLDKNGDGPNDLLHISLGEGIGAGIILDKKLHRGFNAGAGELEYMCFDPDFVKKPLAVGWLEHTIRQDAMDLLTKHLALVIVNSISLLDIHTVILSGSTICALPGDVSKQVGQYVRQYTGWELDISVSDRKDAAAVGAAILALQSEMTKVISG